MFVKLFKHDWKANFGLFSLLSGCALGIACIAAIILRLLTTYWAEFTSNDALSLLLLPAIIFLFFAFLAIVIYGTAINYLQLFRFYKSRFTDQGYLTFTLPVKASHIFFSTVLNMVIWSAISTLVILASFAIAFYFGNVPGIVTALKQMAEEIRSAFFADNFIVLAFYCLCELAYNLLMPLCAIVVGASIAKKHKILVIIGIIYGVSTVVGVLEGLISVVFSVILMESGILAFTANYLAIAVIPLTLAIVSVPLSIYLMKNKLNLP